MKRDTVSIAEARRLIAASKKKRSKYRNTPVVVDDERFDSTKEAKRWGELRMMQRARKITGLRRQAPFRLDVNGVHICGYVADFVYFEHGKSVATVEDSKGVRTEVYRLKARLMFACFGIRILET